MTVADLGPSQRTRRPKDVDRMQPGLGERGPMGDRQLRWAKTETVTTLREEMELGWNLSILERLKVHEGSFNVGSSIVLGLHKKGRRNFRCGHNRWVQLTTRASECSRINIQLKIRPRVERGRWHVCTLELG